MTLFLFIVGVMILAKAFIKYGFPVINYLWLNWKNH